MKKVSLPTIASRKSLIKQETLALIRERGLHRLTIDGVVSRVPFSKGSVYNLYHCKEDVIADMYIDILKELQQQVNQRIEQLEPAEAVRSICHAYYDFVVGCGEGYRPVIESMRSMAFVGRVSLPVRTEINALYADLVEQIERLIPPRGQYDATFLLSLCYGFLGLSHEMRVIKEPYFNEADAQAYYQRMVNQVIQLMFPSTGTAG